MRREVVPPRLTLQRYIALAIATGLVLVATVVLNARQAFMRAPSLNERAPALAHEVEAQLTVLRGDGASSGELEITLAHSSCHKTPLPPGKASYLDDDVMRSLPCPTYQVTITSSGRVVWNGVGDVAQVGERSRWIAPEAVAKLVTDLERGHFFEMEGDGLLPECTADGACVLAGITNRYMEESSHLILAVRRHGETHLLDTPAASEALRALADEVDCLAGTARWIRERVDPTCARK